MANNLITNSLCEFFGTFILLFSILNAPKNYAAVAIGVSLIASIILFGNYSGGNFNPAVTFMMFLNNKIDNVTLVLYIISQILAAVSALILFTILNKSNNNYVNN